MPYIPGVGCQLRSFGILSRSSRSIEFPGWGCLLHHDPQPMASSARARSMPRTSATQPIDITDIIKWLPAVTAKPAEQNIHWSRGGKHIPSQIEQEGRDSEVRSHTIGQMMHHRMKCLYPLRRSCRAPTGAHSSVKAPNGTRSCRQDRRLSNRCPPVHLPRR